MNAASERRPPRGLAAFSVLAAFLAGALPLSAAESKAPLSLLDLAPASPNPRPAAPTRLKATVNWKGGAPATGRFEIAAWDGGEELGRLWTPEMTLSPGIRSFRILAPAWDGADAFQARFETKEAAYDLGAIRLPSLPLGVDRAFVVLNAEPATGALSRFHDLASGLRLDRFLPKKSGPGPRTAITFEDRIEPADVPRDPLAFAPYDLVLLPGDGLALLDEGQLRALLRWIEAGGCAGVFPAGNLKRPHADFLNALSGRTPGPFSLRGSRAVADPDVSAADPRGFALFRPGLGRAAVLIGTPETAEPNGPQVRRAAAFLWRLRAPQAEAAVERGILRADVPVESVEDPYGRIRSQPGPTPPAEPSLEFAPHAFQDEAQVFLTNHLLPRSIRPPPFGLILLILLGFIVAVGPLDYLVLGRLRKRRLTWITFPAICALTAGATLRLSNKYLGSSGHRGVLDIVDVGAGGRVLRANRFELIFAGRDQEARTAVRDGIFSSFGDRTLDRYNRWGWGGWSGAGGTRDTNTLFEGRIPGGYVVRQPIRQWTARLNRLLSLEPPAPVPPLDFDALDPAALLRPESASHVKTVLLDPRDLRGEPLVLHGGETAGALSMGSDLQRFLETASRHPRAGFFAAVFGTSPSGGPTFEDLSILDPTDPKESLVIVVLPEADRTLVLRRLYR